MSTGIGFGIAIPHASSNCVSEVVAAFGRSSTGIEFDFVGSFPGPIHRVICGAERSVSEFIFAPWPRLPNS